MGCTATPAQLDLLADALDAYCAKCGISQDSEREAIAAYVVQLYERGLSDPVSLANALGRALPLADAGRLRAA